MNEVERRNSGPEKYVRIAITKNSRGWNYETTVSLRWEGDKTAYTAILDDLNREADTLARLDIARREAINDWRAESDAALETAFAAAAKDGAR